jgi:hypothetical protein
VKRSRSLSGGAEFIAPHQQCNVDSCVVDARATSADLGCLALLLTSNCKTAGTTTANRLRCAHRASAAKDVPGSKDLSACCGTQGIIRVRIGVK